MRNITKMIFKNAIEALIEDGATLEEAFQFAFKNEKNKGFRQLLKELKKEMMADNKYCPKCYRKLIESSSGLYCSCGYCKNP